MRNNYLRFFLFSFAIQMCLACTPDSSDESKGDDPLATTAQYKFSLSSTTAEPGNVEILGDIKSKDIDLAKARLMVGDREAVIQINQQGQLTFGVPLFFNDSGFYTPKKAQRVRIYYDDKLYAESDQALTIKALTAAAGRTAQIADTMEQINSRLITIVDQLYAKDDEQKVYLLSSLQAFQQLIEGDDNSLRAILNGSAKDSTLNEEDLAMLDSLYANAGTAELLQQLLNSFNQLTEKPQKSSPSFGPRELSATCSVGAEDVQLACEMQLYQIFKDFSTQVIGDTAQTFGLTAGTVLSITGIYGLPASTATAVISAIVSFFDFLVNRLAVGLLPARVTQFDLQVVKTSVRRDSDINSMVVITAVNDPPSITVLDVVSQILSVVGIYSNGSQNKDIVIRVLEDASVAFRDIFVSYLGAFGPENVTGFEFWRIPQMTWGPLEVTNRNLIEPFSYQTDIVTATAEGVHWKSQQQIGEADIETRIRTGPQVLQYALPPGFEYNYGAFGDNLQPTNKVTIKVTPDLVLEASVAPTIDANGLNGVSARAGYRDEETGEIDWQAGINIALHAVGGNLEEYRGITDDEGYFNTFVRLGECSVGVVIDVTANGEAGSEATQRITTENTNDITLSITPQNPTLAPGETLDFDIDVGGTQCTNVIWSAEGGSIDQVTGLYTAGDETGEHFQVTASMLDIPGITAHTAVIIDRPAAEKNYVPLSAIAVEAAQCFNGQYYEAPAKMVWVKMWQEPDGSFTIERRDYYAQAHDNIDMLGWGFRRYKVTFSGDNLSGEASTYGHIADNGDTIENELPAYLREPIRGYRTLAGDMHLEIGDECEYTVYELKQVNINSPPTVDLTGGWHLLNTNYQVSYDIQQTATKLVVKETDSNGITTLYSGGVIGDTLIYWASINNANYMAILNSDGVLVGGYSNILIARD